MEDVRKRHARKDWLIVMGQLIVLLVIAGALGYYVGKKHGQG